MAPATRFANYVSSNNLDDKINSAGGDRRPLWRC